MYLIISGKKKLNVITLMKMFFNALFWWLVKKVTINLHTPNFTKYFNMHSFANIYQRYSITTVSRTAQTDRSASFSTFNCFYRFRNNWSSLISKNVRQSYTKAIIQYKYFRNLIFVNFTTYTGCNSAKKWNPFRMFLNVYAVILLKYACLHLPYLISQFSIN